jgi:hypothetical protein
MPVAGVEPAITVEFVRDGFFHPASVGLTSAFADEHEFHHVTVPLRVTRFARRAIRRPRIGDQGAIVHVLGQEHRTVECVDSSGGTSWLADFHVTELVSALTLQLWHFDVREVSAGVYRASGKGPSGMSVDSTDADPDKAMSDCRAFALRYPE